MDESAFIENNLLEVFEPLTKTNGTFMTMLSSPNKDPTHWFMQALRKGKIKNANFDLVCKECAKLPFDQWSKCTHVKMKSSRLKSKRKKRKHQEMGLLDDEAYAIENLGHMVDTKHSAIESKFIDQLFDEKSWVEDIGDVKYFLLTHDPNGMGWDDGAITIWALNSDGEYICVWVSVENTGDWSQQKAFIKDNVREFYDKVNQYYKVPLICAIECINTPIASDFKEFVDTSHGIEFRNVHVIIDSFRQNKKDEARQNIPGVWLSYTRKYNFVKTANVLLNNGSIKFWKHLGTSHYKGPRFVRKRLEDQMRTFIHFADNPKYGESGKKKRKNLTGKLEMKKDDCMIAWLMGPYWLNEYGLGQRYLLQRVKAGITN